MMDDDKATEIIIEAIEDVDKCDRCAKEKILLQFMFIDLEGESKFYCEDCRWDITKQRDWNAWGRRVRDCNGK